MPSARKTPVISFEAVQQTRQVVRPVQDRIVYEVDVAQKIAAVVRQAADDDQAYLLTLAENLAREDLTPAEEAAGLAVLVRRHGWSLRQVGEAIHKSHAYVSQRLRVFASDDLREPVLEERLSISAAEELLRVPAERRSALVEQAVREHWTPAQARAARLSTRVQWLESNHVPAETKASTLDERLQLLRRDLAGIDPASLSPSTRCEAARLLEVLLGVVHAAESSEG